MKRSSKQVIDLAMSDDETPPQRRRSRRRRTQHVEATCDAPAAASLPKRRNESPIRSRRVRPRLAELPHTFDRLSFHEAPAERIIREEQRTFNQALSASNQEVTDHQDDAYLQSLRQDQAKKEERARMKEAQAMKAIVCLSIILVSFCPRKRWKSRREVLRLRVVLGSRTRGFKYGRTFLHPLHSIVQLVFGLPSNCLPLPQFLGSNVHLIPLTRLAPFSIS